MQIKLKGGPLENFPLLGEVGVLGVFMPSTDLAGPTHIVESKLLHRVHQFKC